MITECTEESIKEESSQPQLGREADTFHVEEREGMLDKNPVPRKIQTKHYTHFQIELCAAYQVNPLRISLETPSSPDSQEVTSTTVPQLLVDSRVQLLKRRGKRELSTWGTVKLSDKEQRSVHPD